MMKLIDQFSRFFIGILFIFSGLIKLNDPIGTAIKMEEYFDVFAQDIGSFFQYFTGWALEIAMVLIVLEITLGVAILIRYKMRITTWVLLALMVFFTILTFYSAAFNKVTDCGCFGDAIKLTPWQSFSKDLVLMVFVLHLFWHRNRLAPVLRSREGGAVVAGTVALCLFVGIYAIRHLPYIDFRAYRVGNNIPAQMIAPEQPIIEYVFAKDGKQVKSLKYLAKEDGYEYASSHVLNEDKIKPKITDYSVSSPSGEDLTASTFEGPIMMLVIADAHHASRTKMKAIAALTNKLEGKVPMLILTASPEDVIGQFRHENQLAIPFGYADATVLKTIIRSNPGIVLWKNGTVLGNWHYNDTPDAAEILRLLNQAPETK